MKTLILLLISFNSFAQIDTIQCPCDMTRQQTRLYYSAVELALKLDAKKHDKEVDKQVKELKYGIRYERIERKKEVDLYKFREDSIKRSNRLLLNEQKNAHKEVVKSLKNDKTQLKNERDEVKLQQKTDKAKVLNLTYAIWVVGIVASLLLILLIIARIKK